MDYKLIIFGSNVYKEIEIPGNMAEEMGIGTTPSCQVRFNRNHFFTDFELAVKKAGEGWVLSCRPNVYVRTDHMIKQYIVRLRYGEKYHLCYENTDSELFYVEFMADFEKDIRSYDQYIAIGGMNMIAIGGEENCQIRLQNPQLGKDYVVLRKTAAGYELDASFSRYGVSVNGTRINKPLARINNKDFFSLMCYGFYLEEERLYISRTDNMQTSLPVNPVFRRKNALVYPRFVRSTRQKYVLPGEEIEVLAPKTLQDPPKKNLVVTLIPAIAGLVLIVALRGVMGGGGMFVLYSAAMMAISTGMSVWTYLNDGKEYREKKKEREERYQEYLHIREEKIVELRGKEASIARQKYLSVQDDVALIQNFEDRLFEKDREDDDFLEVWLGEGVKESGCQVKYRAQDYKDVEDELMDCPRELHDKYAYIDRMPVTLRLGDYPAVGVVGTRLRMYQLLKNMVLDLTARHFYSDVKLYFMLNQEDTEQFAWLRWFKHAWDDTTGMRCFMYDEESSKVMLEALFSELSRRELARQEDCRDMAHYVIFVYRSALLSLHPVSRFIKKARDYGFTFIFFEEHQELLHEGCSKVVYLDANSAQGCIVDSGDGEKQQAFSYPHIPTATAAECALRLGCVYVDEVSLEASLTKNITLYELLHIMNVQDINLRRNWANSRVYESMAVPLGVKSGNEVVYLDLHEKFHGPHGLVAGTTGSGKSEILQTYILSMATFFHPYEVSFVIIDFKGGGMVNQFRNLPHLNGAITNIDGREIERSLLSIRAELRKRQAYFAEYNVNHIDAYIRKFKNGEAPKPLPHLFLIVDEFAELKSDQPDFMKELISTARIGRSLGVHLILATQKPSGVVDDQIWSNSRFKLCLKVQNSQDSTEVLKSPLAAEIKEPGRAYLQVGNNEIFQLFQSAYSGAPADRDSMGRQKSFKILKLALSGQSEVVYEQKPASKEHGVTQLEAIVEYIHNYCEENRIEKLPDICLPPLGENIAYPVFASLSIGSDIVAPIGIYDDPEHQLQQETGVNFSQDNIFILGSSQYGKTNMLQVMIRGLAQNYTPKDVNIYILDFASMILKNYETLSHVGGVITSMEDEKLKMFMRMMGQEITDRRELLLKAGVSSFGAYREAGYYDLPQIVIMVDNMTAFKEMYPQFEDTFLNICREGLAVGISVAAANPQTSGIGYKYFANFSKRFSLHCNDSGEYNYLFDHCRIQPGAIPGRCLTELDKVIYEMQVYQVSAAEKEVERIREVRSFIEEMNELYKGSFAKRIPEIPRILTEQYIHTHLPDVMRREYQIYLGMNFANTQLELLSLADQGVLGISGRPHGGRKNFVKYLLQSLIAMREEEPVEITIIDGFAKKLLGFKDQPGVVSWSMDPQEAIRGIKEMDKALEARYRMVMDGDEAGLEDLPLLVLVLENREAITAASGVYDVMDAYKRITTKYKAMKGLILLTDIENAQIGFGSPEILKQMRDSLNLMVFENIGEQKLYDAPLATIREYAKPLEKGEGYLITGSSIKKIKTVLGSGKQF